ncbi:MAG: metallophosphatase family protein [Spirochaetia bacterium]|nr:metallophosphatase family protein [Spirochaetia bacterium]
MLLGVISDTHGNAPNTQKALNLFREKKIKIILHAGDFGSASFLSLFSDFRLYLSYGNCDSTYELSANLFASENHPSPEKEQIISFKNKNIFCLHGDDSYALKRAVESAKYDYVIKGHTHFTEDYKFEKTRILNPGALYRANIISAGILDIESDDWQVISI